MGKRSKQGSGLRAKKRAKETYNVFEQSLADQAEQDRVELIKDEDLFVLDTIRQEKKAIRVGNDGSKGKGSSCPGLIGKRKYDPSDKDMRQIQKVLKRHGAAGSIALSKRGKARLEQSRQAKQMAAMSKSGAPNFDLWNEAPSAVNASKLVTVATGIPAPSGTAPIALVPSTAQPTALPHDTNFDPPSQPAPTLSNKLAKARRHAQSTAKPTLAVEIAHPGQSYCPDTDQHQDAIGEALSIEIRRNEAEDYKSKPISEGMSEFTMSCIVPESDVEEDSSDDEECGANDTKSSTALLKKRGKLTRAQRNKQKRVRAEQNAILERKQEKQFMHQINEAHIHSKAVQQAERAQAERHRELAQLKEEKKSQPLGKDVWNVVSQKDPIRAPSLPVALTEELKEQGGSLRKVCPKGSLVTDRVESMIARKMITKKKDQGRRVVQGKRRKKVRGAKGTEYLLV